MAAVTWHAGLLRTKCALSTQTWKAHALRHRLLQAKQHARHLYCLLDVCGCPSVPALEGK